MILKYTHDRKVVSRLGRYGTLGTFLASIPSASADCMDGRRFTLENDNLSISASRPPLVGGYTPLGLVVAVVVVVVVVAGRRELRR